MTSLLSCAGRVGEHAGETGGYEGLRPEKQGKARARKAQFREHVHDLSLAPSPSGVAGAQRS